MIRRVSVIVRFAVGIGLCLVGTTSVSAGYGNHAERATENIQTKVAVAKIRIEMELAELRAVAEAKVPAAP